MKTNKQVKAICERFGLAKWAGEFWRLANGRELRNPNAVVELFATSRAACRCARAIG